MAQTTGDWPVDPATGVMLTVRSSAWRYLEKWVDPRSETLVLVWGTYGQESDDGWTVSVLPSDEVPTSRQTAPMNVALNRYQVVVLQPQHANKLDGRTLIYEAGQLIVA